MVSKKVYIATDTLVAFIDRGHPKHLHSAACFRYFAQNNFQIYIAVVSLNEAYHELYQTISPSVARDLLRAVELSNINIVYPIESDVKRSIRIVATTQSVDLTFSKALVAVVCDKYGIPQICTFSYMPQLFALKLFYLPL